ncbi:MAG: hypothetical protein SV422_14530, partial [Pseudomonadota bacterium]|nr:hypothetical protein [Pseudomonadota bacterium]
PVMDAAAESNVTAADADANPNAGSAGAASDATATATTAQAQTNSATAADSDAETSRNLTADITAYRARISDTLANSNPYSAALREQYDALGTLLQQAGDHEDAITAFESAMHIDRVNGGLYTLDQIPVVEKMIASHDALGNVDDVNDLHGYLFYIQQKTYDDGDPRLLAAMEDWADWNVTSYLREGPNYDSLPRFNTGASLSTGRMDYVAVQNRDGSFSYIPRSQMLGAMSPMRTSILDPAFAATYGLNAEQVIDERLRTAREYYERIVDAQTPEEDAAVAEAAPVSDASTALAEEIRVQHKLANVAFAVKQQIDGMDMVMSEGSLYYNRALQPRMDAQPVTRGYISNREALTTLAEQLEQDPAISAVEKAQAWIGVGDWHVGFDNASRGDDAYRKAWEILNAAGMSAEEIAAVFMPEPLVVAPGFAIHAYSREIHDIPADAELAWKGYMDLALNVNRYGDVNGAKVEAVSEGTPQALRTELLRYLRNAKVRPAIVDGEMVKREDVKLRYYYTY